MKAEGNIWDLLVSRVAS